ncbi:MAG: hypothetical protein RLZZ392_116 [Pseudomonadota bacterium]|jgi:hypothetical protein
MKLHLIPKLKFTKLGSKSGDRAIMKSTVVRNPVKPTLIKGRGAYKHNDSDSEDEKSVKVITKKIKPLKF